MGKYVSLEKINEFPIRRDHYDRVNGDPHFIGGIETLMEYIENLPKVEFIRCRECANYDDNRCYCNLWKAKHQPNDGFCHFAERRNNETD